MKKCIGLMLSAVLLIGAAGCQNNQQEQNMSGAYNVYEGYLTICKQYSDRIVKINADQKVEDVVQDALKEIKKIL